MVKEGVLDKGGNQGRLPGRREEDGEANPERRQNIWQALFVAFPQSIPSSLF